MLLFQPARSRFTHTCLRSLSSSVRLHKSLPLEPSTRLAVVMKRSISTAQTKPAKRAKVEKPDYHLSTPVREADGTIQWPAPRSQMERARQIIIECAESGKTTLLAPDKDADGLTAASILRHTLIGRGLSPGLIKIHFITKGGNINDKEECARMQAHNPEYIFVIDHGSRPGPPLIDTPHTALIIDHHHALDTDFPTGSEHVTACNSPPVATSALLTYEICAPLYPDDRQRLEWLAIVGTHGDLGSTLKWEPPFPKMQSAFERYKKKILNDVVPLLNAPRRSARYDVQTAWDAVSEATEPADILKVRRLDEARREVSAEVERCTHTAPKFSVDGRVAVFRIKSGAQVHPVIATRWAGHLQSKKLEVVMVANEGYLPGKTNFSCRIARCASARDPPVNIIEILKAYARLPDPDCEDTARPPLLERVGSDYARGHVQASGGILPHQQFEELMRIMQVGVKPPKADSATSPVKKKGVIDPTQKNTLTGYFAKA